MSRVFVKSLALVAAAAVLTCIAGCTRHSLRRGQLAIFGLVAAPDGQAGPAGWLVGVRPHGLFTTPSATTNRVGAFALNAGLRPGRYVFSVRNGKVVHRTTVVIGVAAGWYRVVRLRIGGGPGAKPGAQTRKSDGIVVFGMVTEADGATPLAGAFVAAANSNDPRLTLGSKTNALTNRMGTFVLRGRMRPGAYVVIVRRGISGGTARSSVDIVARRNLVIKPTTGPWVVVRLSAASGSITGRIFDGSGRPIARATLDLMDGAGRLAYSTRASQRGRYSIVGVIPGTYVVQVTGNGAIRKAVATVGRGRVKKNFTVRLRPW
jgi:hypothetical protein